MMGRFPEWVAERPLTTRMIFRFILFILCCFPERVLAPASENQEPQNNESEDAQGDAKQQRVAYHS